MAKILISDLMGTLIPLEPEDLKYLYTAGCYNIEEDILYDQEALEKLYDKAIIHLSKKIKCFLSQ